MTRDEFVREFRGRHLAILMEFWSVRHEKLADLGMVVDRQTLELKKLLGDMWDAMHVPAAPYEASATNGVANGVTQKNGLRRQ